MGAIGAVDVFAVIADEIEHLLVHWQILILLLVVADLHRFADVETAAVCWSESSEHVQERRFADAVWPDDADAVIFHEGVGEIVEDRATVEAFCEVLALDDLLAEAGVHKIEHERVLVLVGELAFDLVEALLARFLLRAAGLHALAHPGQLLLVETAQLFSAASLVCFTLGFFFEEGGVVAAVAVELAAVELEVGIDTFRLVEEDDPTQHVMHTERYHVSQEVVDAVHKAKAEGHRVIAVGTTAVRSLESAFDADAPVSDPAVTARYFEGREDGADTLGRGDIVVRENATTQLYLMPGSTYHVVDALITNFHVPRSTLMMLVSALATRDQIMDAYAAAIEERYRFFSFGDAMLIC